MSAPQQAPKESTILKDWINIVVAWTILSYLYRTPLVTPPPTFLLTRIAKSMETCPSSKNNIVPPTLPRRSPHPTTQAFFDALDAQRKTTTTTTKTTTTLLEQRSRSLGWRNRYSQQEQYPIDMSVRMETNDVDGMTTTKIMRDIHFSVQQIQRGEVEGTYGTGATVWPAAMVLIKYLERHPHWIQGRRIVDLGSGTGVTSLAAGILGASHVVCTDGEESVVQLAKKNCQTAIHTQIEKIPKIVPPTNESSTTTTTTTTTTMTKNVLQIGTCPIKVEHYWWGTKPLPDNHCDVILVADCVLPKLYPIGPLVTAIADLLRSGRQKGVGEEEEEEDHGIKKKPQPVAILSYEHRYYPEYDPRIYFQQLAHEQGLNVEVIPHDQHDPVYTVEDIDIWHVTLQSP